MIDFREIINNNKFKKYENLFVVWSLIVFGSYLWFYIMIKIRKIIF
jgi:hypothetical protein